MTVFSFKSDKEKSNPFNLPMHMYITPTPTLSVIQIKSTKAVEFLQYFFKIVIDEITLNTMTPY